MIVYSSDLRKIKFCSGGAREFFKTYQLDYSDFLKNGIDSELLKALNNGQGDAMSNRVIEYIAKRDNQ